MPHRANAEILVVDDDPLTRQLLVRSICGSGLQCIEAASGIEAWQRVHERVPALLLLDFLFALLLALLGKGDLLLQGLSDDKIAQHERSHRRLCARRRQHRRRWFYPLDLLCGRP